MSTSNLDHAASRQACVPPVCEVHVPNYLLSVQIHEDKVEVYTSVQVYIQYDTIQYKNDFYSAVIEGAEALQVAGLEQFPILTCI